MTDENAIVKPEQQFGSSLVAEAHKRHEENQRERLLNEVALLLQHRDEFLVKAEFAQKAATWYSQKLTALENGEFTYDARTNSIVPNDKDLQRANY